MKYTLATLAALAGVVMAEPKFLNTDFSVVEGKPFTIKYSGCEAGCTIVLQNGESDDLKDYKTLTASAKGDSFTFTPSGLPSDTYNFKITDNSSGEENYSSQFTYQGDGVAPTSAEETTAAETSAAETTSAPATTEKATTLTSLTKSVHSTKAKTTQEPETISTPAATKNATTPIPTSKKPTKTEGAASTTEEASETEPAATGEATTVPDSGASHMTSSLALIAGAVMAMVYLN
ncbi:hypothetical protein ACJ41O_002502 [Fusarium nematophilum]